MINLDDYIPLVDTSLLDDDELVLWYGTNDSMKFLRLIENCDVKYSEEFPKAVFYFRNDKYIMEYELETQMLWINITILNGDLVTNFGKNFYRENNIFENSLNNYFGFKIKQLASLNAYSSKGLIRHKKYKYYLSSNKGDYYIKLIELHFNELQSGK